MFYLIHQAGKMASQTLELTLVLTDRAARVERHHYLGETSLTALERACERELSSVQSRELRKQVDAARVASAALTREEGKNVWVLTGFRDPLDFSISAFFQNLGYYYPSYTSPSEGEDYDRTRFDGEVEAVIEVFKREFETFLARRHAGAEPANVREIELQTKLLNLGDWFDGDFKEVHGVDVFDVEIGTQPYVSFTTARATFILYRMETFRESLVPILSILPIPRNVTLANQNLSVEKDYALLYRRFRELFVPTRAMVEHFYNGKYFAHFYSQARPLYEEGRRGNRLIVGG
jgi:hypothetical protein